MRAGLAQRLAQLAWLGQMGVQQPHSPASLLGGQADFPLQPRFARTAAPMQHAAELAIVCDALLECFQLRRRAERV